jgi:hypothetical protein
MGKIKMPKKGPSAVKGRTAEGLRRKELIDDTAKSMPKKVVNPGRDASVDVQFPSAF